MNQIKQLRQSSNLTQKQLADYLGIDQVTLSELENETRSLNTTLIDKICSLFNCTEAYLLGQDSNHQPSKITTDDLKALATINKIAQNIRFMTKNTPN